MTAARAFAQNLYLEAANANARVISCSLVRMPSSCPAA